MNRHGNGKQPQVGAAAASGVRTVMDRELLHQLLGSAQEAMGARETELLGPERDRPPTAQELLDLRMAGVAWAQAVLTAELADNEAARAAALSAQERAAVSQLIRPPGKG